MPIYEFACQDCGHEFETIQSFSDSTTPACPNCQGRHVQRCLSAPAIHFKGSGWYVTDSKKASKSSATGVKTDDGDGRSETAKSETGEREAGKGESGKGESGKGESGKSEAGKGETGKKPAADSTASSTAGKE